MKSASFLADANCGPDHTPKRLAGRRLEHMKFILRHCLTCSCARAGEQPTGFPVMLRGAGVRH